MADTQPVVEKVVTEEPVVTPATEIPAVKTEEEVQLEAKKAQLEEDIAGLSGTIESLKEDIVRKRQERKAEEGDSPVDEEALLAKLQPRIQEQIDSSVQPVIAENERLSKELLKSNEEALKAKRAALDSLNARIASTTASRAPTTDVSKQEEVELSAEETKIANELGLKNKRYMKDVEVL